MIARKRLQLHLEGQAMRDLDDMQERAPEAIGFALMAIRAAMARPQTLTKKSGHLVGHWSVAFPAGAQDGNNQGRLVVKLEDQVLVVVAVDEDHDRAYAKARARVKPKA